MAIRVYSYDGSRTYENGIDWKIEVEDKFVVATIFDEDGTEVAVHTDVKSIQRVPTEIEEQLKEAIDLLRNVDDGNYRNQTDGWTDRAENLLGGFTDD